MILVDIYADKGISGTSTEKRTEFNRMIKDSKNGKLDLIFVKSVSRFSRNTLDCLETIRVLKNYGTNVYFENDGISTESMESEFILYLKSKFAEDEALTVSRRVKKANQMRMRTGDFAFLTAPFGYECKDNTLIPKLEESEIVREIYNYYLCGMGIEKIAKELNFKETVGKPWNASKVRYILKNEKYIGDTLHQKSYTPNELPLKRKLNNGELEQYYVQNTQEAIIDKETFYAVKELFDFNVKTRSHKKNKRMGEFTGKIYCGDCGWKFKKIYHSEVAYWVCCRNGREGLRCSTHPIKEEVIEKTFCSFYNRLKFNKSEILVHTLKSLEGLKSVLSNSDSKIKGIDSELLKLNSEKALYFKLLNGDSIDEVTYLSIADEIEGKISLLNTERKRIIDIDKNESLLDELRKTVKYFEGAPNTLLEYNHTVFEAIIEKFYVEENAITFVMKCGLHLREVIVWN